VNSAPSKHAERREAALAAEAAAWDTQKIEPARQGDIPCLDISDLFDDPAIQKGQSNTNQTTERRRRLAEELGRACREVGFFYLIGHQVPAALLDAVFEQNRRFHACSGATKQALAMDQTGAVQGVGYLPLMHNKLPRRAVGNNNEAFIVKRDIALGLADNLWPAETELPGFRGVLEQYAAAMETLSLTLLPLYARALGVAADFFDDAFSDPLYRLRLTRYPARSDEARGFGIAPHVDTTFLTILAQDAPGLVVFSERRQCWIRVQTLEGALVVNSGELLKQWTNDEFLSVKHFATNPAGASSRYSVPFFFNANSNYPMACVPTCTGPDRPPKYPTLSYAQSQGVVQGE